MKIDRYQEFNENIVSSTKYNCPICRSKLYQIENNGSSVILNCSSSDAKYWELPKGSDEQKKAHDHFVRSTTIISNSEYEEISKEPVNLTGNVIDVIPFSKVKTNS